MNFELTEEQIAVRDAARDFAQNVLKPGVIERDENQTFPKDEIKQPMINFISSNFDILVKT